MDDLLKVREELWSSVDGVSVELLRRPNNDGWSILHILEHLHLVELGGLRIIKDALSKPAITADQIQVNPLQPVLDRTDKLDAPGIFSPKGLFHSLDYAHEQLDQSREQLLSFISSVPAEVLRTHGARHPRYGMLSTEEWVQLVGVHERRHIAQIEEMKESFNG